MTTKREQGIDTTSCYDDEKDKTVKNLPKRTLTMKLRRKLVTPVVRSRSKENLQNGYFYSHTSESCIFDILCCLFIFNIIYVYTFQYELFATSPVLAY